MIIKNGLVFTDEFEFIKDEVNINGDRIVEKSVDDEVFDASDCYVVPGFVDIHTHGNSGSDFCDDGEGHLENISRYLATQGVTSFLGTSMTFSEEILTKLFSNVADIANKDFDNRAVIRGINMEGPFIALAKKGAQSGKYIVKANYDMFCRLMKASGDNIKIVDVAPEHEGAIEFIKKASTQCAVSLAHTGADYDKATEAFNNGATNVTHLFNAMDPFTHRAPGVVGAAFDAGAYVEMICDGIHLHPAMIRSMFKMMGTEHICLISDAMQACGMPNGNYMLGGQDVIMTDGKAVLADGTIAGSATSLGECVRKVVSFGIKIEDAIRSATATPAMAIKMYDEIGSLTVGKRADVVVLDKDLRPVLVLIGGKKVKLS